MADHPQVLIEHLNRMKSVLRLKHYSLATERSYCDWVVRYWHFIQRLDRNLTSEKKFEAFLTDLALEQNVSAATQNHAFNAILFFYKNVLGIELKDIDALRARRPSHVRIAISVEDTYRLLDATPDVAGYPTNLIARMLYGSGLRPSEPLNLRVKDLHFSESKLFLMGAKGGKDRLVRLPCALVEGLKAQLDFARAIFERDQKSKIPIVLPHQLAKKYPGYQFDFQWAWVFPQRYPCEDPRTQRIVRFHLHEANIQRAVKIAAKKLGLCVTPHNLRHCYATHLLERGVNMKALQEAMGHKYIETTAGYCHADAMSVPSPVDLPPSIVPQGDWRRVNGRWEHPLKR